MTRAGTCIQVTPEHELWPIFLYGLSIGVMIMPNSSLIPWGVGQGLAHRRCSAHVTNWNANHRECKPSTWGSEHAGSMEEFSAGSGSWPGLDPRPAGVSTSCKPLVSNSLSKGSSFSLLLISAICPWLLPTWDQLGFVSTEPLLNSKTDFLQVCGIIYILQMKTTEDYRAELACWSSQISVFRELI